MKNEQFSKHPLLVGFGVLVLFLAVGVWSILAFVEHERQRDLADWQITLGIMADSRADSIHSWIDSRFSVLNELAGNGSLQLYTQQLHKRVIPEPVDTEPLQLSYLRNLIRAAAEREGFVDRDRLEPMVPANVAFQANSGLILFDRHLKIITATPGMSRPDRVLQDTISTVLTNGRPALYDVHLNENNQPIVGFVVPVFALQATGDQQEAIGILLGLENARNSLFPLFVSARNEIKSGETLLVRQDGDSVVYLSPLADGTSALKRRLAVNAPDLAAAYAVKHPGGFMGKRDYGGASVLMVSRELSGTPWILVQKIDVDEALSESNAYRRFLQISLLLVLLLIVSLLVAAWWYGSNAREHVVSHELRLKSRALEAQTHVLNAINDNIADYIFLVDDGMRFMFANKVLARQLGVFAADLEGKTLSSVLGPAAAKGLAIFIASALESGTTVFQTNKLEINNAQLTFHAAFIPVPYRNSEYDAVLVSLHDVTQLQRAQEKQDRLLHQLVKAMMRAIDLHDPYSANHSAKTADIAVAIGRSMEIDQQEIVTLEIATNLCNLGKLSIPSELLAKTGELTIDEQKVLKNETRYALDILAGIDLDDAVIATIAQKNECLDGSGYPHGLQKNDIIRTARILAAANAFVAMVSPRAYRDKLSAQEALELLMDEVDSKYDRQVVAALFHVVENEMNWSEWQ